MIIKYKLHNRTRRIAVSSTNSADKVADLLLSGATITKITTPQLKRNKPCHINHKTTRDH